MKQWPAISVRPVSRRDSPSIAVSSQSRITLTYCVCRVCVEPEFYAFSALLKSVSYGKHGRLKSSSPPSGIVSRFKHIERVLIRTVCNNLIHLEPTMPGVGFRHGTRFRQTLTPKRFGTALNKPKKPNVEARFSPNTSGKSTKDFEVAQKTNRRIFRLRYSFVPRAG